MIAKTIKAGEQTSFLKRRQAVLCSIQKIKIRSSLNTLQIIKILDFRIHKRDHKYEFQIKNDKLR